MKSKQLFMMRMMIVEEDEGNNGRALVTEILKDIAMPVRCHAPSTYKVNEPGLLLQLTRLGDSISRRRLLRRETRR